MATGTYGKAASIQHKQKTGDFLSLRFYFFSLIKQRQLPQICLLERFAANVILFVFEQKNQHSPNQGSQT